MSAARPTRRWFQFGLGTMLLVVTVFAVWLAWELNFIRARQSLIEYAKRNGGSVILSDDIAGVPDRASIPSWRNHLGDKAVSSICIGPRRVTPEAEIERAHWLFPEANVLPLRRR